MKIQYFEIHSSNSNRLIVRRPNNRSLSTCSYNKDDFSLLHTLKNVEINHSDKIADVFNKYELYPIPKIYDGLNC